MDWRHPSIFATHHWRGNRSYLRCRLFPNLNFRWFLFDRLRDDDVEHLQIVLGSDPCPGLVCGTRERMSLHPQRCDCLDLLHHKEVIRDWYRCEWQ